MSDPFIELNIDNISSTPLCCIYRKKSGHRGVDEKKKWLIDRFNDGHIYRKIENEETAFIEYAPLEKAWVPIEGDNYIYIYCLYVIGEAKFLSDFGGHQDAQLEDAVLTLTAPNVKATKIAILDGVCWLKTNNKMYKAITEEYCEENIMSALLLKDFIKSL